MCALILALTLKLVQMLQQLETSVQRPLGPSFQPDLLPAHGYDSSLAQSADLSISDKPSSPGEVFHGEFYLTQSNQKDCEGAMPSGKGVLLRQSRPDLIDIFSRVTKYAKQEKEQRVAVCVCGPTAMIHSVQVTSAAFSKDGLSFDCHHETFMF
jgi:hypothetical protein